MALRWREKISQLETPKLPLPIIAGIVAALIVFGGSLYFFQKRLAQESQSVLVPVAKNMIVQGAEIKNTDIEYQHYKTVPENCAVSGDEVVKKVALTNIYKGEPFRKERIGDNLSDKQYVALNVDLARSGLVRAGDLVDIYLLRDDTSWAYAGELVASNAAVVDVRDINGQTVTEGKIPAVVQVLVKPEEVPRIVRGAGYQNKAFALVKKQKESQPAGGISSVQTPPAGGQPAENLPRNP